MSAFLFFGPFVTGGASGDGMGDGDGVVMA